MANIRVFQRSFSGGEMSPEMFGRIDDEKFQTGAAKIRNFVVRPQGTAESRTGFAFVAEVKDSSKKTRIIPFTFNNEETSIIEVGAGYFRFFQAGVAVEASPAVPYEIANTYLEDELFDIHYVQSADVLTMVHHNHKPCELKRTAVNPQIWQFVESSFSANTLPPTNPSVSSQTGAGGSSAATGEYVNTYAITAVSAVDFTESNKAVTPSISNDLSAIGAYNTISWGIPAGNIVRFNVYKKESGLFGFCGQAGGSSTSFKDDNIAPDMSDTPPIYDDIFTTAGNYPQAVSYFEQRKCFAGTDSEPQTVWMTRSGTENDMSYSLPTKDNDRIKFRIAAREVNSIRHVVPLNQLLFLTSAAEWKVTSVNSDAITPSSVSVEPQSYVGSSRVQPIIVNSTLIYCAGRGGHVREMGYSWQSSGYVTGDLSIRANHLFDNETIAQMSYSKAPYQVIWFISSSGKLLGFTYLPEQEVGAWHHHDTKGSFESCACVSEGNEDFLYVVVKREINGKTVRFVERQHTRQFGGPANAFFVDSGGTFDGRKYSKGTLILSGGVNWNETESLTLNCTESVFDNSASDVDDEIIVERLGDFYQFKIIEVLSDKSVKCIALREVPADMQGAFSYSWKWARNVITELDRLEGEEVSILADGAVHPRRTVKNGRVTLNTPCSLVQIGLPYDSDIETLPIAIQADDFGQSRDKNVSKVFIRVYESSGIFAGFDESTLVESKQRDTENYGKPPDYKNSVVEIPLISTWRNDGSILIRQSYPLPITVVSLSTQASIGG